MYNTHPKLCYKILGKKVRIILEILRYTLLLKALSSIVDCFITFTFVMQYLYVQCHFWCNAGRVSEKAFDQYCILFEQSACTRSSSSSNCNSSHHSSIYYSSTIINFL